MFRPAALVGALAPFLLVPVAVAEIAASQVISYTPGDARSDYTTSASALGPVTRDSGYGAVNPFNPPFAASDIVIVGQGGQVTLELSADVPANGRHLGVFSNNGYVSTTTTGTTTNPVSTFATPQFPSAIVRVSQDGSTWKSLNSGNAITFTSPTNAYLDTNITNYYQPLGTVLSSSAKPYLGSADDLGGKTYDQIRTALNGSAGGTWLDLREAGLPSVRYVQFEVPSGAGRMVIDAVSGLPAAKPITAGQSIISLSVGAGAKTSNFVIDFGPQSYHFQVNYDGELDGYAALQMIDAASDYDLTATEYSWGAFVTGHDFGGYELVGDGSGNGPYWSHWVRGSQGWEWGMGISHPLTDGSWDGFVWSGLQATAPDLPIAVPEPAGLALAGLLGACMLRRRRR
jgi:MYXO-CTERM domain-containing protein